MWILINLGSSRRPGLQYAYTQEQFNKLPNQLKQYYKKI